MVREFDEDMNTLCNVALRYVKQQDPTALVEHFNSFVFLAYYDKTGCGKQVQQLGFHRDQRWSTKGEFMTSQNSQKRGTATCILTLGDERTLHMQCYKDNDGKDCRGSIPVKKPASVHSFVQRHGSMFYLDPRDEESVMRSHFDLHALTYFKHGGVRFGGRGKLSVGFGLRAVTRTCLVDKITGRLVVEKSLSNRYVKNDNSLREYLADTERREKNERQLRMLCLLLKKKYFGRVEEAGERTK